jgi:hypothetical protein
MFLIPLIAGSRFGAKPGLWVRLAAVSGFTVTILATIMNLFPIVDVASPLKFGLKVLGTAILINGIGAALYFTGQARRARSIARALAEAA